MFTVEPQAIILRIDNAPQHKFPVVEFRVDGEGRSIFEFVWASGARHWLAFDTAGRFIEQQYHENRS